MLLVPYGRGLTKKEVGTHVAVPAHEIQDYANQQILPKYAIVVVSWAAPGFEEHISSFPLQMV